jgi:cysteine-rich repeat protein
MTNSDGNGHMNCTIANCDCRTRTVKLNLTKGSTYEIAVFGADRHPTESNYQLTLSGFATKRTVCMPVCGDGVISGSEECDDGDMNMDGVYGGCTTQCKYGPYCGDGMVDPDNEVCDDGPKNGASYSTTPTDGCTIKCQRPAYCGDGNVDPQEECDLGGQNGQAGVMCGADCKRIIG